MKFDNGVSLIICTYNGASLLPKAIPFILQQKVPSKIEWEVLVIDNASTDCTPDVVRKAWDDAIPLRIVHEPKPGLIHARLRGIAEARYEYLSFIDDDNWIAENWIATIYHIFGNHPEVGICGSQNTGNYEIQPPAWFESILGSFAIGNQGETSGDITEIRGYVWGAGMSFRKSAFEKIRESGFRSILTGRKGKNLSAGEDTELSFAFHLAGWRIWYSEDLKLQHYIPAGRLSWDYLVRMYRGFGKSRALFPVYQAMLTGKRFRVHINFLNALKQFLPLMLWKTVHFFSNPEGKIPALRFELHKTKLFFSIRYFFTYKLVQSNLNKLKENLTNGREKGD